MRTIADSGNNARQRTACSRITEYNAQLQHQQHPARRHPRHFTAPTPPRTVACHALQREGPTTGSHLGAVVSRAAECIEGFMEIRAGIGPLPSSVTAGRTYRLITLSWRRTTVLAFCRTDQTPICSPTPRIQDSIRDVGFLDRPRPYLQLEYS